MMKKTTKKAGIWLSALLALVCVCTAGGGTKIALADISAPAMQNAYSTTNVALGKRATYKDVDGNVIPEAQLNSLHGSAYGATWDPYTALTNGDNASGDQHNIVIVHSADLKGELRTFVSFDLERSYTINEMGLNFWNNHSFIEVVVQIAESEDFSDAVTVYNNDTANEMKQGAGTDPIWQDTPNSATKFSFSPVRGRYVRVSGRDREGGARFTEIEVYGVTSGMAPVAGNLTKERQRGGKMLTLGTEIDGAEIYYTTDGSMPTENSEKYTQPVRLSSLGENKILVRAVAVKDGVSSLPSEFRYDITPVSENLIAGVLPTMAEDAVLSHGQLSFITNGHADSFNNYAQSSARAEWLYFDMGTVERVYKVRTKFWNDHRFRVVIQLATDPQYTQNVYTVFNNDRDNVAGAGKGYDGTYQDKGATSSGTANLNDFEFVPVSAQYMRVYCEDLSEAHRKSMWEEIQVWSADKPDECYDVAAKNVMLGKLPVSYKDKDGNDLTPLTNAHFITDGTGGSFHNYASGEKNVRGWLTYDFEKEYTIDKVITRFYNDHNFLVIVQLATDAAFTQNVYTVFNNDTNNSMGAGAGTDGTYTEPGAEGDYAWTKFREFALTTPVTARYIRISIISTNDGVPRFEEVQAWSQTKAGEPYTPVESHYPTVQRAITKAKGIGNFTIANGATEADLAEKLPTTLAVEDHFGNAGSVEGAWACANYDGNTAGTYTFTFTPTDTAAYIDLYDILHVNVTVAAPADRAALKAAIDAADALEEEDFVTDSWPNLAEPLAAAKEAYGTRLMLQADIDAAKTALDAAVNKLIRRGDKTELNSKLDAAAALTESDYSAASWADLQSAVADAQAVKEDADATQTAVDAAVSALTTAIEALQELGDKTALQTRYDAVKDTAGTAYTKASFVSFTAALESAKTILDKTEAYEDELATALKRLNDAFAALVQKANFAALDTAIASAKEIVASEYTSATATPFTTALEAAQAVAANDESAQTAIDEALATLTEKQTALVKKGNATELNALLATCNYAQSGYTASTFNAYTVAKQAAEAAVDGSQADIDAAKTNLQAKIDGLKALGDKTALLALIGEVEAGAPSGELAEALSYAKSVAASNDVDQAAVDEAVTLLTTARDNASGKKGCGGEISVAGGMFALVLLGAAAVLLRRKKAY